MQIKDGRGNPMGQVDFNEFSYYPALQCSFGEERGYRELSTADKQAMFPIFELSQRSNDDESLQGSTATVTENSRGRPFVLDLCKDPAPSPFVPKDKDDFSPQELERIRKQRQTEAAYNASLAELLAPADGFENWRILSGKIPNAVVALQFTDPQSQRRNILRQGALLLQSGQIAIRLQPDTNEMIFDVIAELYATTKLAADILIVVDCGQARVQVQNRAAFAAASIKKIQDTVDVRQRSAIRAVCLSNSFPNANHDGLKPIKSFDWRLWRQASKDFPFLFGDYGAVWRRRSANTYMPSEWRATVVYPTDESWLIYRDPNAKDPDGWISGSAEIVDHDHYSALKCWGGDVLAKAANGDLQDLASARHWRASKVNMHLHRQAAFAAAGGPQDNNEPG